MLIGAVATVRQPIEAPAPVDARRSDSGSQAPSPAAEGRGLYYSPKLRFDTDANVLVIEFRDLNTGKLERTIPTKGELEAYEKAAKIARAEAADQRRRATQIEDTTGPASPDGSRRPQPGTGPSEGRAAQRVESAGQANVVPLCRPTPAAVAAAIPSAPNLGGGSGGLSAAVGSFRQIDV